MAFSNPFFFLNKIHSVFRMFLVGSALSLYGSLLYEFLPVLSLEHLLYYFAFPAISIVIVVNVLPDLGRHNHVVNTTSQTESHSKENAKRIEQTNTVSDQVVNQSADQSSVLETEFSVDEAPPIPTQAIEKLLENGLEPVRTDLSDLKIKVNGFDDEIGHLKTDLETLKTKGDEKNETYETTLRDLKAFQAEIDNPFNFISKYFEMLNVSNLHDPDGDNSDVSPKTTNRGFKKTESDKPGENQSKVNTKKQPIGLQKEEENSSMDSKNTGENTGTKTSVPNTREISSLNEASSLKSKEIPEEIMSENKLHMETASDKNIDIRKSVAKAVNLNSGKIDESFHKPKGVKFVG